jgi:hypothetical protein
MKAVVAVVAVAALAGPLRAYGEESHSHPVPERLGTVTFPTSCAPQVAQRFERAVALLHSFAYSAAEQAFRETAAADPGCALAHWGIAMSYYHQLWSPPGPAELERGWAEVQQAEKLGSRDARERQFIAAAAAYYRDFGKLAHAERARAYAGAMAGVARDNPQDTEAQVFYALALIATAAPEDRTHLNQKRAADILEPIFLQQPDHPGVAHYLIHAYDSAELAARGLSAARAYSKIAPSAPHALHMPSHIYTRLGLWEDSIASNRAARAAAHTQGDVGEELHAMDYLTYAYLQLGRDTEAQQVVAQLGAMMAGLSAGDFKVGYAATAMPVRLAIERHRWGDAALLQPLPGSAPHVEAIVYWARAVADARAGKAQAAGADIAQLDRCRQQLQDAGNDYWARQVGVLAEEARAWQLAATGSNEPALQLLRLAAAQEESVEKLPVTPGPIVPAREQLGELLLAAARPQEAAREFQAALRYAPGRRGSILGAAEASARASRAPAAPISP